ncbi:hypothetical protein BJ165DRAFT_1566996, partial [Panaeolus papilionaceus]
WLLGIPIPYNTHNYAIWRCRDCFVPHALCHGCMRQQHLHNPFHKIECWTGNHFRRAALWEVGAYFVVKHHKTEVHQRCRGLDRMIAKHEEQQQEVDRKQQVELAGHIFPADVATETFQAAAPDDAMDSDSSDSTYTPPSTESPGSSEMDEGEDLGADDTMDVDMDAVPTLASEADEDREFDRRMQEAYRAHGLKHYVHAEEFLLAQAAAIDQTTDGSKVEIIDPDVRQPATLKRIAHTNGYHRLHVIVCSCDGEGSHFGDYVAAGLMPASFTQMNTLFTLQLLHFARLATLELQASVYQIHQLLVRQMQPLGYIIADDLYHLLRRMLRINRWLKKLKWAGFAHLTNKDPTKPAAGELGIFCSTCPQPGVNLPPDWEEKDPDIYGRSFVADGNFKADHLSSATRAEETPLYDGAGMMPKSEIYKEHIRKATETRTKAPCENTFHAIENSMMASKVCDITGVVGIACARHGIYCPNGLVDLYRGEQQKNIDFAFVQAIVRTNVDVRQRVTMIYDIGCQYSVHLRSWIDEMLSERGMELLEIDHVIGMFHVHGHNDKCYFRFAPSFIPGLGMVDREIMETNWLVLNKAARAQRTATQVGRLEAMDDHTSDLNYKHTMKMAQTLERKYLVARRMVAEHETVFKEVSLQSQQHTAKWTAAIEQAEVKRLQDQSVMDIYGADPNRMGQVQPAGSDSHETSKTHLDRYMHFALVVEDTQLKVKMLAQQAGQQPSEMQSEALENEREDLRSMLGQLWALQAKAGIQYGVQPAAPADAAASQSGLPEHEIVFLPSNKNCSLDHAAVELACRVQHLNALLNNIHDLVVERSLQFSHVMQTQPGKVKIFTQLYNNGRVKLQQLKADNKTMQHFQELEEKDMEASTLMVKANDYNSRDVALKLSWIWRACLLARAPHQLSEHERDNLDSVVREEFMHVHWLWARALFQRWQEEVQLLTNEMLWTVLYWRNRADGWLRAATKSDTSDSAGAYAYQKRHACIRLATHADMVFKQANSEYKSPM